MEGEVIYNAEGEATLQEVPQPGEQAKAWTLLSIPLVFLLSFILLPILQTLIFSFLKINLMQPAIFTGVINYVRFFGNELFLPSLINTLTLAFMGGSGIFTIFLPVCIAFALYRLPAVSEMNFRRFFSLLFFFGITPLLAVILAYLFNPSIGPVNALLGIEGFQPIALHDALLVKPIISIFITAQNLSISLPLGVLFYLGMLHGTRKFPPLPISGIKIWTSIGLFFVFSLAFSLKEFPTTFVTTNGGPGYSSLTLLMNSFQSFFSRMQFGVGLAGSFFDMILLFICGFLAWLLLKHSGMRFYFIEVNARTTVNERKNKLLSVIGWAGLLISLLFILALLIFPLFLALMNSFKTISDLVKNPLSFFPEHFTLWNYNEFTKNLNIRILFLNYLIYLIPILIIQLGVSIIGGYALGRLRFAGRKFIFFLICLVMFISPTVFLPTLYLNAQKLNLLNNYIPLILAWLGCPLGIVLFKLYFEGTRSDIAQIIMLKDESVKKSLKRKISINTWKMLAFYGIIATLMVLNEFIVAHVLINDTNMLPFINFYIKNVLVSFNNQISVKFIGYIFSLIPMLFLAFFFFLMQKRFFTEFYIQMPGIGTPSRKIIKGRD